MKTEISCLSQKPQNKSIRTAGEPQYALIDLLNSIKKETSSET